MVENFTLEENQSKQIGVKKFVIAACRQFAALLSGYLLMCVNGLHIGWGIFNPNLKSERWTWTRSDLMINCVISSYYVGIFLGALVSRKWLKTGVKAFNYQTSALLCVVSSIILITLPEQSIQIIMARLIAGFAIGLAYLTLIMQCEILKSDYRGILISFCHFFIFLGVYVAVIMVFIGHYTFDDPSNGKLCIIGIINLVLSLSALICTYTLFRESPADLIRQENYDTALTCLLELRNEKDVTYEIESEFNELKLMVQEDDKLDLSIVTEGNIKSLLLMSIVSVASVLSFNYPLNSIRLSTISRVKYELVIFIGILITIRVVFGIIACNLSDVLGRKKIILISGCSSGVILVLLGIISSAEFNVPHTVFIIFFIAYELNSTLGINSITTVLMFEAFPLIKRNSVATILVFESLVHIILISATFNLDITPMITESLLYGFGGLIITLSLYLQFRLPETMGLTLRQARNEFRTHK